MLAAPCDRTITATGSLQPSHAVCTLRCGDGPDSRRPDRALLPVRRRRDHRSGGHSGADRRADDSARLAPKPPTPAYVQYDKPPVSFDGDVVGLRRARRLPAARPRLRLRRRLDRADAAVLRATGASWSALGQTLDRERRVRAARRSSCAARIVERLRPALRRPPRARSCSEDYLVFVVNELERAAAGRRAARGARRSRSRRCCAASGRRSASRRRRTILRHRISYLADDLVVPTWNAAFVYDTPAGAQAALEILEFANSQLLEFRYYDERLDDELAVDLRAAAEAALVRPVDRARATRAPRGRCTRCSSTSTS